MKILNQSSRTNTGAKPHHHLMPLGGRLSGTSSGDVTYAPWPGRVMAAAMGAGVLPGSGGAAMAQTKDCIAGAPDSNGNVVIACGRVVSETQSFMISKKGNLTITEARGFTPNVANGNAFCNIEMDDDHFRVLSLNLTGSVSANAGQGVYPFRSANGDGEISNAGHDVAAALHGLSDACLYANGQLQDAGFASSTVVDNEAQVYGSAVRVVSAAAEVGYRLSLRGMTLSSRVGLNWSEIEIDDFMDTILARVFLEDGDTNSPGRQLGTTNSMATKSENSTPNVGAG